MSRKLHEVMEKVGKAWINGADKFFCKLEPDPWAVAHKGLERDFKLDAPENDRELCLATFEAKCLELLSIYKRMLELQSIEAPVKVRVMDAFMRGLGGPLLDEAPKVEPTPPREALDYLSGLA